MSEEVKEYNEDEGLEEITNVFDVLFAMYKAREYTIEELNRMRKEKCLKRGGFVDKTFLEYVCRIV